MTEQEFYSLYKKSETVETRAKNAKIARDKIEELKDKREIEKANDYE